MKGGLAKQRFAQKQQRNQIVGQLNTLHSAGYTDDDIRAAGPNAYNTLKQKGQSKSLAETVGPGLTGFAGNVPTPFVPTAPVGQATSSTLNYSQLAATPPTVAPTTAPRPPAYGGGYYSAPAKVPAWLRGRPPAYSQPPNPPHLTPRPPAYGGSYNPTVGTTEWLQHAPAYGGSYDPTVRPSRIPAWMRPKYVYNPTINR